MRYFYLLLVLFAGCTMQDDALQRNNPFDPGGGAFSENQPPRLVSVAVRDSAWIDYDHDKQEGTLILSVHVEDPNESYDTLTYTISWDDHTRTDTLIGNLSANFEITRMKPSDNVDYSLRISDIAENTIDTSGSFSTPNDVPPEAPEISEIGETSYLVKLYWNSVNEADSYDLYRAETPDGVFKPAKRSRIQEQYYGDDYVASDTVPDYRTYWYRVAAVNEYGACRSKESVPARRVYTCLKKPSSISASSGTYVDHIRVGWRGVSSMSPYCDGEYEYYVIYRRSSEEDFYLPIDSVPYEENFSYNYLNYNDSVTVSETFYYKVAVFDDSGRGSDYSYSESGYLKGMSAPYSVRASEGTYDSHVLVTWNQVAGAEKYVIYRAESSYGDYEPLDTVTSREYRDSTLKTYSSRYYRVAAMNHLGNIGERSSYDEGRLKMLPAPTGLTASDSAHHSYIYLNWDAVPGAYGYVVYRATSYYGSYMAVDTVHDRSCVDTAYGSNTKYYYIVAALSSFGEPGTRSSYTRGSAGVSLRVLNVNAGDGLHWNYVRITWSPVQDTASYIVYRKRSYKDLVVLDTVAGRTWFHDTVTGSGPWFYAVAAALPNGVVGEKSEWDRGAPGAVSPVSDLNVSQGTSNYHIEISWAGVPSAVAYVITSARDDQPVFSVRDTVELSTYFDSVPDFKRYYYYVTPIGPDGSMGITNGPIDGYRAKIPAPSGVTATTGEYDDKIVVVWDTLSGAYDYIVERRRANADDITAVDTLSAPPYLDTAVEKHVSFEYRVTTYVNGGLSDPSDWVRGYVGELTPPAWLGATDGKSKERITLSWGESSAADRYVIYRSDRLAGPYSPIDTVQNTVYHDTVHRYGEFYYRVASMNTEGDVGSMSDAAEGYLTPVSAPQNLQASYGIYPSSVFLIWNSLSEVETYVVSRRGPESNDFTIVDTVADISFTDNDLANSQEYTYKVAGIFPKGRGPFSPEVVGRTMFAPETPMVESQAEYIQLSWQSYAFADGYYVYRGDDLNSMAIMADKVCGECAIIDSIESTKYYSVSYYTAHGESPRSSAVPAKRLKPAPTGLRVVDSVEKVLIEWNPASTASSSRIFRGLNGEEPVIYGKTSRTSYLDPAPKISSATYRVAAIAGGERTALSEPVTVRMRQRPEAPRNPMLTAKPDHLVLSWNAPSNGTPEEYRIYRSTVSHTSGYEMVAAVADPLYRDSVEANREYFYKISALAYDTEGPKSESVGGHVTGGELFPPSPEDVSATKGTMRDTVLIHWKSVPSVSGYRVYRNETRIAEVADTFYYDLVDTDTHYEYRIKSYNPGGESLLSEGDVGYRIPSHVPSEPRNVVASDTSKIGVRISWDQPVGGVVKGYYIYRSHTGTIQPEHPIDSTAADEFVYWDYPPASYPTFYYYSVSAWNNSGEGEPSESDGGTRGKP